MTVFSTSHMRMAKQSEKKSKSISQKTPGMAMESRSMDEGDKTYAQLISNNKVSHIFNYSSI